MCLKKKRILPKFLIYSRCGSKIAEPSVESTRINYTKVSPSYVFPLHQKLKINLIHSLPFVPSSPLRERQILKSNISNQFIMYLNNQPNSICDLRNLLIANSKHTHTHLPFSSLSKFPSTFKLNNRKMFRTRTLLFSDRVPSFSNFPPTFHHHRPQTTFNKFIRRKDLCLFI